MLIGIQKLSQLTSPLFSNSCFLLIFTLYTKTLANTYGCQEWEPCHAGTLDHGPHELENGCNVSASALLDDIHSETDTVKRSWTSNKSPGITLALPPSGRMS